MKTQASLHDKIRNLEVALLQPEVRTSLGALDNLLAEDFVEFGSSGRSYSKQQVIDHLHYKTVVITLSDFKLKLLAPEVVLATYRSASLTNGTGPTSYALRSSVWRLEDRGWRMVFHQGTPIEE